jgi:hypothetical protein
MLCHGLETLLGLRDLLISWPLISSLGLSQGKRE